MKPAIRTQVDELFDTYSLATAIDTQNLPDMTRQEFKDDTDVNKILQRYGVDGLPRKPEYSAVDYDLDLQTALNSIREAERALAKLPEELREKYSAWERLLAGAYSGQLKTDLDAYQAAKAAAEKAAAEKLALDQKPIVA